MKRNDPYTRMQRQQLSTVGLLVPLLTLAVIFEVLYTPHDPLDQVIILVPYAVLLLVEVFVVLRYRSNLTRLDQRRERALQGDRSLLAREQPLADPNILPLPTTIKLDQSWHALVFLGWIITFAVFLPILIVIVVGSGQSHPSPGNHALLLSAGVLILLGGTVVALLVALVLIFFLMRNQLIFTIVVDERGLSSTYQGGITSTINWSDARLFAVLNPEKPSAMRFYELSNEQTVVRWVNMPTRTLFQRRENMAHAEYRRKVQALLALIVARTGLPLYDLSTPL